MSIHQITSALALVATLVLPNASRAESNADRAPCFLGQQRVFTVKPYYGKPTLGRKLLQPLRGAEVQLVPASGLTSELLEARLKRLLHAPDREALPACLLDVGRVHIESDPLGYAESVILMARDPGDAEEVFRRATSLVDG